MDELNDRERNILRYIIQQFILTAAPVGSRNITKKYDLSISPATVRNIMSDLEESGFIDHPHTSAGRIPTDKGYRFYVDSLMDIHKLKSSEKGHISKELGITADTGELLRIASSILSSITKQLAYVSYPKFDTGVLEKLQIIQLSSTRILVVISIKSGLAKTITLEINSEIDSKQIESVQSILNERLSSLTLKEIRTTFAERFKDVETDQKPIIRLFFDSADKIFSDIADKESILITGAKNVIKHPEFVAPEKFQSIVELIEDKDIIIHIIEKSSESFDKKIFISIGSENEDKKLEEYSFISKEYNYGDITGTLGIIGPKRMEYAKIVAIIDYLSKILTETLKSEN